MNTKLTKKIILEAIRIKVQTRDEFLALAKRLSSAIKTTPPAISALRAAYLNLTSKRQIRQSTFLDRILQKRAVRTLSGVAIITVLTKPFPCPGQCVYCPTEARMPKSYLSNEPAAARALRLKFNPYRQVAERIKALEANGHLTDKIELIVKGGTWSAYPWKYQKWFIKRCFEACNLINRGLTSAAGATRGPTSRHLSQAQKKNEKARHRVIGLTLETRPDWITPQEILRLRELGCTRVELGVQHTDDKILDKIKRGHTLEQVKQATKFLKDAGFKVDYHLMPMLPGSTPARDFLMFKKVFTDPDLKPDMIKIYPCAVIKNSALYAWWRKGFYKPYSGKKLLELLIKVKSQLIPRYCRISRLIRDIPSTSIEAGSKVTNLREVIQAEMKERGLKCKCLRCREIGHQPHVTCNIKHVTLKLFIDKYKASGGTEYFLSIENPKREIVYAFCRLRLPNKQIKHLDSVALLRELHTYGHLMSLHQRQRAAAQHIGLGRRLMQKAEEIARKANYKKMAVISGIGVREYYKKLGYRLEDTYMVKSL